MKRFLRFALIIAVSPFIATFVVSAAIVGCALELYEGDKR